MTHYSPLAMGRVLSEYPPPRNNVVLLSCMDLRLVDELASFMDRDNLTNRYDHLIMAGASLGPMRPGCLWWKKTFFDHLRIAMELHAPIEDVYLIEHRSCGAYTAFLGESFDDTAEEQEREHLVHHQCAGKLAREIQAWAAKQPPIHGKMSRLAVRCFLMDLRGDVELLGYYPPPADSSAKLVKSQRPGKSGRTARRSRPGGRRE